MRKQDNRPVVIPLGEPVVKILAGVALAAMIGLGWEVIPSLISWIRS